MKRGGKFFLLWSPFAFFLRAQNPRPPRIFPENPPFYSILDPIEIESIAHPCCKNWYFWSKPSQTNMKARPPLRESSFHTNIMKRKTYLEWLIFRFILIWFFNSKLTVKIYSFSQKVNYFSHRSRDRQKTFTISRIKFQALNASRHNDYVNIECNRIQVF